MVIGSTPLFDAETLLIATVGPRAARTAAEWAV